MYLGKLLKTTIKAIEEYFKLNGLKCSRENTMSHFELTEGDVTYLEFNGLNLSD